MYDFHEFLGGGHSRVVGSGARIYHMLANVILDHFRDESIERTAARGRLLQDVCTLDIGVDRPFDRLDLAAQPLDAVQEFHFFSSDVAHD